MAKVEDLVIHPIQLSDTLRKLANEARSHRQECQDLVPRVERLLKLLRTCARLTGDGASTAGPLYTRPLQRMTMELVKTLQKTLSLVRKCNRRGLIRRMLTLVSGHEFKSIGSQLENSMANISWFIAISAIEGVGGFPPIASSEPLLAICWEQIALLYRGSEEQREEAAVLILEYARNNDRFTKIMVEEEAIGPVLKVLTDGTLDAKEAAAKTLGYLAKDAEVVRCMIQKGIPQVFVKVLNRGSMRVQVAVAWALAEMVDVAPEQQDLFLGALAIRSLVTLLGEALEEPANAQPAINIDTLMKSMAKDRAMAKPLRLQANGLKQGAGRMMETRLSRFAESGKGLTERELSRLERENADPEIKAELRAEVARALWKLAKGNSKACTSITETRALLCFATLMEKSKGSVQFNSVMAVVEIAAVAERDAVLRRTAFKWSSPAAKAVVDQLLRLAEKGTPELQVACIKAIGYLSRTFPARETRFVKPLVRQLEGSEDIAAEAIVALTKFACEENFLHSEHCRAIIEASAAGPLLQLVFLGRGEVQLFAVTLMCYLALYAGDNEALAKAEPLPALKKFAKTATLAQNSSLESLLTQAISHLEIYQGRGLRDVSDAFFYE